MRPLLSNGRGHGQRGELVYSLSTCMCNLRTLELEMSSKERDVLLTTVKMVRCQHRRKDWSSRFKLNLHQTVDYSLGDEIVTIDTSVDHQRSRDYGVVLPALY